MIAAVTATKTAAFARDFPLVSNFIPHSPYGFDILGGLEGVAHFFPEMPDVHGDGVVVFGVVFLAPDTVEQILRAVQLLIII